MQNIQVNSADDSCGQQLRWHPMTLRFLPRSMWSARAAAGELPIWLQQDLRDHHKLRKSFFLYIDKYHNSPNPHHTMMFHQLWRMYHLYHLYHPFHDTSDMWMVQHIYNHHNPPGRVGCNFPAADAIWMDSSESSDSASTAGTRSRNSLWSLSTPGRSKDTWHSWQSWHETSAARLWLSDFVPNRRPTDLSKLQWMTQLLEMWIWLLKLGS